MMQETDSMGPVSYLVVEFPGNRMKGEAFPILLDLAERGTIRIIDLLFVRKERDGSLIALEMKDLDADGDLDLRIFEGASTGLLGSDDVAEAGSAIEPGSSAGILIYENRWAAPFVNALNRGGAQLVAAGHISLADVIASLDATEPAYQ